jgi:hypothetical protein
MNYPDSRSIADWHEVTGIKVVEAGVDFELYTNADILRKSVRAASTSTAVLAKTSGVTWKAPTEVYTVKYPRPDASWGRRDETAKNEVKGKAWPKAIGGDGGARVGVSYGGAWADKVISVDVAPLPSGLDNQAMWNSCFDYVYAAVMAKICGPGTRNPSSDSRTWFPTGGTPTLKRRFSGPVFPVWTNYPLWAL